MSGIVESYEHRENEARTRLALAACPDRRRPARTLADFLVRSAAGGSGGAARPRRCWSSVAVAGFGNGGLRDVGGVSAGAAARVDGRPDLALIGCKIEVVTLTVREFLALFPPALLLAGCAQQAWVKDGATEQDLVRDRYACERDVRQSGYYGDGLVGAVNMQGFFNRCMEAQGYSLQSVSSPQPAATTHSVEEFRTGWPAAVRDCKETASTAANGFANAYQECMRSHGF